MKSWLIERLVKWMTPRLRFIYHNPELWRYVESKGYHVTPVHFYQPIPDSKGLDESYRAKSETVGIDWNEPAQLQLLRDEFPKYAAEYQEFFDDFRADERFAGKTLEFVGHDPYVYHCMIRHYKPGKVVEVGAGFSTLVATNAARENGDTRVVAIEPYPNEFLGSISNEIHLVKGAAQSIDIDFFTDLQPNDILFIDSSHVVKTGGDVCFLVLEILPRLCDGVIVHFHDIFLPFNYPLRWLTQRRMFWTEQYLLQAYLMHNKRARILFANRYMAEHHKELLLKAFPGSEKAGGGSLWLQL